MALALFSGPGCVRSHRTQPRRLQGSFRLPRNRLHRSSYPASVGNRGRPQARPPREEARDQPVSPPPAGGRSRRGGRPARQPAAPATYHLPPSRASDRLPGFQTWPAPAFTCGPAPAWECQVKAPRRRPRRARKSGGFVSAAGVASGPPARAPWRAGGWGSGPVPGKSAGTGTVPNHFGPERSFCQE